MLTNGNVHARALFDGLYAGTLLLCDRGSCAFAWCDERIVASFFWTNHHIASPSFPREHLLLSQNGLVDAIV